MFEAILDHRDAVSRSDSEIARLATGGDPETVNHALRIELIIGRGLVAMAPTTAAGLEALRDHLQDERYRLIGRSDESTARLIAQRIEKLAGVR